MQNLVGVTASNDKSKNGQEEEEMKGNWHPLHVRYPPTFNLWLHLSIWSKSLPIKAVVLANSVAGIWKTAVMLHMRRKLDTSGLQSILVWYTFTWLLISPPHKKNLPSATYATQQVGEHTHL